MMSIFSVARAPGLPLVYLGTTLIGVGIIWMFYVKPWLAKRQAARALAAHRARENRNEAKPADPCLCSRLAPARFRRGPSSSRCREIAIQDGGRTKPLDTLRPRARQARAGRASLRVRGDRRPRAHRVAARHRSPSPDRWKDEPIVKVTHAGLRAGGRAAGRTRTATASRSSPTHKGLQEAVGRGPREARPRPRTSTPSSARCSTSTTRSSTYQGVMSGEALHIVPHPDDPKATWYSLADLRLRRRRRHPAGPARARARRRALVVGLPRAATGAASRPRPRPSAAASPSSRPASTPRRRTCAIEVHYNRLKPFRTRLAPLPRSASSRCSRASRSPRARCARGLTPRSWSRLPAPRLRHGAARADLGPARRSPTCTSRSSSGGLGRRALRARLRGRLQGALLRGVRVGARGRSA